MMIVLVAVCVLQGNPKGGGKAYAAVLGSPSPSGQATAGSRLGFSGWTGINATEAFYKDVFDVRGWKKVTVQCNAVTKFGNNTTAFANTVKIYIGPTPTGPWAPANVGTTALSYTANFSVTFDNNSNYVAISQTRVRNGITVSVTPGSAWP